MGLMVIQAGLVRVTGIEPVPQAWEAHVLPLNYTRISKLPQFRAGSLTGQGEIVHYVSPKYFRKAAENSC